MTIQSTRLNALLPAHRAVAAIIVVILLNTALAYLKKAGLYTPQLDSFRHWVIWPAIALCFALYVRQLPGELRARAASAVFANDGTTSARRSEWISSVTLVIFFLALFAILFAKNQSYLQTLYDLHWHMPFLDYDLNWGTPVFSLSGNILYFFEMQIPFNTSLAPLNGLAHLVSPNLRLAASYTLLYLAMSALLWVVGCALGLRPVARIVFAGLTALFVTVPFGLDHLVPFLPPPFDFVTQAMLTRYWEEVGILTLSTAFAFFWIGQHKNFVGNAATGLAFLVFSDVVALSYPALAFFDAPIIALYCLAFLATALTAKEFWWKVTVGGSVLATMLGSRFILFFQNLYSDSFGAYFIDRAMKGTRLQLWSYSTVLSVFWPDPKVLLIYFISLCTAIYFIVRGRGAVVRIAIAMLTCETGIVLVGAVVAYLHIPLSLYYADQLAAPVLVGFFTLPAMLAVVAAFFYCDEIVRDLLQRANRQSLIDWTVRNRPIANFALSVVVLIISSFLIPTEPPFHGSQYPPASPPSVQILRDELALRPGKPFNGRVLTLVQQDALTQDSIDPGPTFSSILGVLADQYGRYTGNDHWNDLLYYDIPTVGEYAEYTTPVTFVFLRAFFGHQGDPFQKALFLLRRYDEKAAHMIGIRYVVTNAASLPGGTLVYQGMAGDTPLRLFRVDDTNVGQYSPTRPIRITTAAQGLELINNLSFDPQRDAVVEEDLSANLVPGRLQSLTVEAGPTLHVQADSDGTSLLVLPFEYSHCLRLEIMDGSSARLLPVNLQQTGLLFDHRVDIRISYRFGPFDNPYCRGDDIERIGRLRLPDAF